MAKKKASGGKGNALENVTDYRHENATRVNIPPAKIAAGGGDPEGVGRAVRLQPAPAADAAVRSAGAPDRLFDLLEQARQRPLTEMETKALAEALRTHEPWLEWAGKREAKSFDVDPVAPDDLLAEIHSARSSVACLGAGEDD